MFRGQLSGRSGAGRDPFPVPLFLIPVESYLTFTLLLQGVTKKTPFVVTRRCKIPQMFSGLRSGRSGEARGPSSGSTFLVPVESYLTFTLLLYDSSPLPAGKDRTLQLDVFAIFPPKNGKNRACTDFSKSLRNDIRRC